VAVAELNRAATGTDLPEVASAYAQPSEAADEMARAVAREDRIVGAQRGRARGAA
jgi:hypothetical protein